MNSAINNTDIELLTRASYEVECYFAGDQDNLTLPVAGTLPGTIENLGSKAAITIEERRWSTADQMRMILDGGTERCAKRDIKGQLTLSKLAIAMDKFRKDAHYSDTEGPNTNVLYRLFTRELRKMHFEQELPDEWAMEIDTSMANILSNMQRGHLRNDMLQAVVGCARDLEVRLNPEKIIQVTNTIADIGADKAVRSLLSRSYLPHKL